MGGRPGVGMQNEIEKNKNNNQYDLARNFCNTINTSNCGK